VTPLGRIAYTTLVAFVASLATLLAVHVMSPDRPRPATPAHETERRIDRETLALHDSAEDCWMAIHGRVYDFTDYLPKHPTPPRVLIPYCGTDATEGWETKGIGRPHSPAAHAMLQDYEIGVLAD
jgi:cytochrome b involved in lipid metabolism